MMPNMPPKRNVLPTRTNRSEIARHTDNVSLIENQLQYAHLLKFTIVSGFDIVTRGMSIEILGGKALFQNGNVVERYANGSAVFFVNDSLPLERSLNLSIAIGVGKKSNTPKLAMLRDRTHYDNCELWLSLYDIKLPIGATKISDGEVVNLHNRRQAYHEYNYVPKLLSKTKLVVPYVAHDIALYVDGNRYTDFSYEREGTFTVINTNTELSYDSDIVADFKLAL